MTLLCLLFLKTGNFPTHRSTLYEKSLCLLLEEWDASKEIARERPYKDFDTKSEEIVLAEVAYNYFLDNRLVFETSGVAKCIEEISSRILRNEPSIDGRKVLKAIAIQHGILIERISEYYSFSHLTLQEFLSARFIVDNGLVEETVQDYLFEERWREVFLLIAGLITSSNRAAEFFQTMEQKARNRIADYPKLIGLLEWAERMTAGSASNIKPVGKRAVGVSFLSTYIYSYSHAHKIILSSVRVSAANMAFVLSKIYKIEPFNAYIFLLSTAYRIVNFSSIADANKVKEELKEVVSAFKFLEGEGIFGNLKLMDYIVWLQDLLNLIPSDRATQEEWNTFGEELIRVSLNAFKLTSDMIELSEEEAAAMRDYLYATKLIVDCERECLNFWHPGL